MIPIKKSLHKSFTPKCGSLIKDFVNGTINDQEISPALANEPTLVQQCRRNGYMILQIGDQLRTVYCNGGDVGKGFTCPNCNTDMCVKHMEEHLEGTMIDPNTFKIPTSVAFGAQNPPAYDGSTGGNMRAQMAMDDADKNNEIVSPQASAYEEMLQRRKDNLSLRKSLRKNGKGGEHDIGEAILHLPLVQRIQAEVWGYLDEYKAPMSAADLSVELASRGKDQAFQDKTEQYAHSNDNWLPALLENMVAQGQLRRGTEGGYVPVEGYVPPIQGEQ